MLGAIREAAAELPETDRRSLVDLAVAMARLGVEEESVRRALRELEDELGVLGSDAAASLLAGARPRPVAPAPAALFDIAALRRVLDGRYVAVRDQVRELLAEERWRPPYRLDKDAHRAWVRERLSELAERGIGALAFPGETSDSGDTGTFIAAFETLAFGDLSVVVKAGVQWGLFGGSIFYLGNDAQRRELLDAVAHGELLGCFAMSETGHGSNVAELETTARYLPQTKELEIQTPSEGARKDYVGGAARDARMATVFAQLEVDGRNHGVHPILVPIRDSEGELLPGVRAVDNGEKLGLHGVDNGRLWFDKVRVPRDRLLGRYAMIDDAGYHSDIPSASRRFFTMLGNLVWGRVSVAAAAVSAAKVGMTVALRYAAARRQFGPPGVAEQRLLDYPAHQRRLMPRLAATYAMHFAVSRAREQLLVRGDEDNARRAEATAAGIKTASTWHANDTLQACREACGGQGYLAVNRIGVVRADCDVFATFEGDNVVLLQLVAKSLLSDFKSQFEDAPVSSLIRLVTQRATSLVDRNPLRVRRSDGEHLRDRDFVGGLIERRATSLLESAARRIRRRVADGATTFEAAGAVQNHLLAMARAHVDHFIFESFCEGVAELAEGAERAALERLVDLYGLSRLEEHAAWFLENGYFEARKARGVRKEVELLCAEVAQEAIALVEAFGIPEVALSAPIAFGDPAWGHLEDAPY